MLYLQDFLGDHPKYELLKVRVADSKSRGVQGFFTGGFTFGAGNNFSTIQDIVGGAISDKLIAGVTLFQSLIENSSTYTPLSTQQTAYIWTGSTRPTFSVDLAFFHTKEGDDVRAEALRAYKWVLPNGTLDGSIGIIQGLSLLRTPNDYKPILWGQDAKTKKATSAVTAQGTVTLTIGKWFSATDLVVKDIQTEFSTEVVGSKGLPMFCKMRITMEPFKMITYSEFKSYFNGATDV